MSAVAIVALAAWALICLGMIAVAIWVMLPLWREHRARQAEIDRCIAAAREQVGRYFGNSAPPPDDEPRSGLGA